MASSTDLKAIYTAAYPLIEQQLDLAEMVAGLRDKASAIGLDWSQIKALLKAQIQDERDESGNGKRVKKIVEKAENASTYAGMLGLANMNEKNFSAGQSYADAKLVETVAKAVQTETGKAALLQAVDIMIAREEFDPETGEITGSVDAEPVVLTSLAAREADESAATNSPETANEMHERPSTNDEPSLEAGPQAEASLAGIGSRTLADREGRHEGEAASAVLPTDFEPPAFLARQKTMADYRPHCLEPEACRSSKLEHCYTCRKALEATADHEVAA